MTALILASQSPRRKELLSRLGVQFEVLAAGIDESLVADEQPLLYALRMAEEKARTVKEQVGSAVVLAADTAVVCGDNIFGKPGDNAHARSMLEALSGSTHRVISGCVLLGDDESISYHTETCVTFVEMSTRDISDYIATDEGNDKAGGYAIQGLGSQFIKSIQGSYSGVVGLPLAETRKNLIRMGIFPQLVQP